jgi:two-component system, OmpR family, sensor kinase
VERQPGTLAAAVREVGVMAAVATHIVLRSIVSRAPPMEDEKSATDGEIIASLREENAVLRAAVRARDDFISVAAHELRNPMMPLVGQISLLRKAARLGGGAVPDRIVRGIERLDFIVRRYIRRSTTLLDISRLTYTRPPLA